MENDDQRVITSDATIACASNWLEEEDGTMMMASRRRDSLYIPYLRITCVGKRRKPNTYISNQAI
jgi:hypothetical protein